jgi:glycosyltransferase involved in cell wall biosynthesis
MHVILMTTWNRARLLRQALAHALREADAIRCPLVIADDWSTEPEALREIELACQRENVAMIRPHGGRKQSAHHSIVYNNLAALAYCVEELGADFVIKMDDDVALQEGAAVRLLSTAEAVLARTGTERVEMLYLSGHRTPEDEGRALIAGLPVSLYGGSHCFILYRGRVLRDWLPYARSHVEDVATQGFDWHLYRWAEQARPEFVPMCLVPGVAYHCGNVSGVHVQGGDWNLDPPPEGEIERW